ncbi:MAG: LysR family transcriptional regulator, partial [Planctomycetota bacterium]
MHIETLKIFCDLAELQSFLKTAEKHLLSQPAISQQLAQLELVHKCQLINRKKRPIELTREGQLFYKAAKDIIERFDQLQNELKAVESSAGGRIH